MDGFDSRVRECKQKVSNLQMVSFPRRLVWRRCEEGDGEVVVVVGVPRVIHSWGCYVGQELFLFTTNNPLGCFCSSIRTLKARNIVVDGY